jgi:hypothetical protein
MGDAMVRLGARAMKGLLVLVGAGIVGNMIAEKFLLKGGPDDPTGFIEVAEGFGMDDVARAVVIAGIAMVARRFLG